VSDALDPYEVLGVPRTATTAQIRAAYVARARTAHPDLVGGRGLDIMRAINEAWAVLKDARRRSAFDAAAGIAASATGRGPVDEPVATAAAGDRPHWTGAMGKPPGRPSGPVLDEGIFAGWSIGEIARRDRGYLQWLRDRPEGRAIAAELDRVLDPQAGDEPAGRGRRG
jgi:curved DNA-binding protein CbpA